MSTNSTGLTENKPLASIRGIAALWVVGHHWLAQSSVPWVQTVFGEGYRAVDVFFVLSGLILTMVYRELHLGAAPRFMVQRIFRVYPLHIASLLVLTTVVQIPNVDVQVFLVPGFVGSMLLLQPFFHLQAAANPVAWSIGVEMVFYLLFPFLLLALRGAEHRRIYRVALPLLLCVLFVVQFHFVKTLLGAQFGVDGLQRGIYSFVLGMVLAKCRHLVALPSAMATAIECFTCIAIGVAIALHGGEYIPGLAAVLIFSLSFDIGLLAVVLRKRVWVWLGHISFSIYLLHYPIQVAMDKIGAFEALGAGDNVSKLLRLASLMMVLLLASTFSYRFIEMPCRHIPARFSTWRKSRASRSSRVVVQAVGPRV